MLYIRHVRDAQHQLNDYDSVSLHFSYHLLFLPDTSASNKDWLYLLTENKEKSLKNKYKGGL